MLQGKRGVILGVANKRSLAWAIAKACVGHGAEVALTYQGDRFEPAVRKLAGELAAPMGGDPPLVRCDVTRQEDIDGLAVALRETWGTLDFVVHSIAWANPDELRGRFSETSQAGFAQALHVSAYSLIPVARALAELMPRGGAVLALSYLGGERVVPNYNVMGVAKAALDCTVRYLAHDLGPQAITVNAVAPGPIRTVSATAIGDFGRMLDHVEAVAPLRRNVTSEDVGHVAAFLCSDMAKALTGAHVPIDCGYSIMGAMATAEGHPAAPGAEGSVRS